MPQRSAPITIDQIAQHAGLSRQTVSNILNGKGELFRATTCDLVFRSAEELGYRPNSVARALRSGRFHAVGLVSSVDEHAGRIVAEAVDGIHAVLSEHNLHMVSGRYSDENLIGDNFVPKVLRELLVDGLIVNYTHAVPPGLHDRVARSNVPFIWLNVPMATDSVRPDDLGGGRMATEHLISLGHRRIAFVNLVHTAEEIAGKGRPLHYSVVDRFKGYRQAMTQAGLKPRLIARAEDVPEKESPWRPFAWLRDDNRPTAVIFYNELGLGPLLVQLGELGLRIPRDISVMVFANKEFDLYGLPMDYVMVPHRKLGESATRALVAKIDAKKPKAISAQLLPCELRIQGASTAPAR